MGKFGDVLVEARMEEDCEAEAEEFDEDRPETEATLSRFFEMVENRDENELVSGESRNALTGVSCGC